jgi:uncharacterized SAM-binding protein YcdF (DUF218 family)
MDSTLIQISASSWSRPLIRVAKDMTLDAGLVCALIAAGILVRKTPAGQGWAAWLRRVAGLAGFAGLALLIGFSSPLTSNFLRAPLLNKGKQLEEAGEGCPMHPGPVVVLGGGATPEGLPGIESLERIHAASLWIAKNHPASAANALTVLLSGGPASLDRPDAPSEAAVMVRFLKLLNGNDRKKIEYLMENRSLNTHDNAVFSREILTARQPSGEVHLPLKIVLVTSQVHMARAAATFAKSNFEICAMIAPEAAPVFGLVTEDGWLNFPTARKTSATLNEWFGMLGYWMRGWS